MTSSLHGKKIIITRDEKGNQLFSLKLSQLGAIPKEVPLLKISCKDNPENLGKLANLSHYEWIVFTSANGADCFFKLMNENHFNVNQLSQLKIAVVGHKTEECLRKYGFVADFIPSTYNAETLASEFLSENNNVGKVLLVRGNISRDTLPIEYTKAGISYETVEVYETAFNLENKDRLNKAINADYDFITFMSPSTVNAFHKMANVNIAKPIVCIGTTTGERAVELGYSQILEPNSEYSIDGMIQCMIDYINKGEL